MKKHELQEGQLDELGRKLLEAGRLPDDELERIVSAPHLLSGVRSRIKAEQRQAAASTFNWRTAFSFLRRPNMAAAFGAVLIAAATFGGFYLYSRQAQKPLAAQAPPAMSEQPKEATKEAAAPITVADIPPQTASPAVPGEKESGEVKATTAFYHPSAKPVTALKTSYKKNPAVRESDESGGEFYPLTFTGSSNEIAPGAQIVRVELPRSSLFSMGVDLPDDERSGTVKADLLISADGVARGFRLVK
jgi:hypothetical protein